jgi:hypothetical protein
MTTTNEWSVIAGIKAMVLAHHPSFHWTTRTVDYNALSRFLAGTIDTVSPSTHTALSLFCDLIEDVLAIRTLAEEQLASGTILDIDENDTSDDGDDITRSVPPDNNRRPERPAAIAAADAIDTKALATAVTDQDDDFLPGQEEVTEPQKKGPLDDTADAASVTVAPASSAAAAATSASTTISHDEAEQLVQHWKDKCQRLENEKDCQDIAIGYLRDQLRQAWAENRRLVSSLALAAASSTTTARMPQHQQQRLPSSPASTNDEEETNRVNALVEQSKAILMAANDDLASFPLQHHNNIDDNNNKQEQPQQCAPQAPPPVLNCDEALTDEEQRAPPVVPTRKRQRARPVVPTRKSQRRRKEKMGRRRERVVVVSSPSFRDFGG